MDDAIRSPKTADFESILALNNDAVPHVNRLDGDALRYLCAEAAHCRVATVGGVVAGFLLALTPDARYDSPNFRKFCEWFDAFYYVDRIVVDPGRRGRGLGRALYDDLAAVARPRARRIVCEVNVRPRNEGSLRFHRRAGFFQMGTQRTEKGSKTVALLVKPHGGGGVEAAPGPQAAARTRY